MWLRQIKIGSRLITAFGLLGLVLLLQGLMSLQTMSSMRASSEEIEKIPYRHSSPFLASILT
ncbi:hypothetical protein LFREDSHE_09240 [Shewanella baltica]